MSPEVIAALVGLVGVIIGAIPTYLFMRQRNLAEVDKLRAETDKIKAEAEKIRAEFKSGESSFVREDKVTILFVAANPTDTARLRLDDEVRGIKESLRKSNQNIFELDQAWSVRWDDLHSHLLRRTPDVLHFSGHGNIEGIVLEDEGGHTHIISTESVNNLLLLFSDKIRLVFINTMYSDNMCKELAQNIDFVIGISGAVGDKRAKKFAMAFYEAIAYGKDIRAAFEFARRAIIDAKGQSEPGEYQLFTSRKQSEKFILAKLHESQ